MPKKVYPLQEEIQKDLQESCKLLQQTMASGNAIAEEIATKYFNAITHINQICVDRKRY